MKKLFIKLAKILGFEIIDQNQFSSPTLNKELNEDLSILNEKSIVLPLGDSVLMVVFLIFPHELFVELFSSWFGDIRRLHVGVPQP